LSCEYGQGYFFARPLDAQSIEGLLRKNCHWLA
jgi:EAL domain-containing protein (putative c-di-GMP-specific phosphodiesterase class I)